MIFDYLKINYIDTYLKQDYFSYHKLWSSSNLGLLDSETQTKHKSISFDFCLNVSSHTVRSINIWTLTQFSSFWLCTPPQWILNETIKMCFKCRLSALIWGYLHPNQVNGVGITTHFICGPPFLRDQMYLDNWLLSCSVARCVLFTRFFIDKEQIKGLEFISSVVFVFGICCCQLSIWSPKSCHYHWSKPSLGWKMETNLSER